METFDVLILGAGAAGIYAARELARAGRSVAVVEARDRIGGRAWTQPGLHGPIELGAEFIHGGGKLTKRIAREANLRTATLDGALYEYREGRLETQEDFIEHWDELQQQLDRVPEDISVQQFLDRHLADPHWATVREQLARYTEGYYAADLEHASTHALRRELRSGDHEQDERLEAGYGPLFEFLWRQAEGAGARLFLNREASVVRWRERSVEIQVTGGTICQGTQLLWTLPIGLWQQSAVAWDPALPEREEAVRGLGYGAVLKATLEFSEPFWQQQAPRLGFLFSREPVPTWWSGQDPHILSGWAGGPRAWNDTKAGPAAVRDYLLQSLGGIFSRSADAIAEKLEQLHLHDWVSDPFSRGAYSFEVVGGSSRQQTIRQPELGTLFFAGEGLCDGPLIGTVEGAFQTAHDAVKDILSQT